MLSARSHLVSAALAPALVAGLVAAAPSASTATQPHSASATRTAAVETGITRSTATVFSSRVIAGSRPVKDRRGRVWDRLPATLGSRQVSTRLSRTDIARTTDDVLYRANVRGTPGYVLPVPANDRYTVRLYFAEDVHTRAGDRVFDVRAEGRIAARGVDVAGRVGRGAAYTVTFPVTVTDGELNLDFVARAGTPFVSAVEVTGTRRLPRTGPATHVLELAPGNVFQQSVRRAPALAPDSAAVAANVRSQVVDNWNGVAAVNAYRYNVGFHRVPPGTKKITLGFYNCQRKQGTPWGLYDGPRHFVDVPVPTNAVPASGTDGEMTIYDPATDRMWDLWMMRRNPTTRAWEACWGGRMDGVSRQKRLAFPQHFGTAASGLSLAAGMVSVDDVKRGRIDHAVAITVIDAAKWNLVSWPAARSDGYSSNPHAIREGQRMRLDPRVDVDRLGLTPFGRLVAKAAQEYGFIVVDKGGAVAIQTEYGVHERLGGRNAWDWLLGGPDYTAMQNFPWQSMQVLPVDHGKPSTP